MIVSLQSQNIDISKFEMAVDFFKSTLYDASKYLLKKIINSIDSQNKKLNDNYEYYKNHQNLLLAPEMIKEYEQLDNATDVYEILLKEVEEYKDKTPEFMQLYKSIQSYYETLVTVPTELAFLEAHLHHDDRRLKNAS